MRNESEFFVGYLPLPAGLKKTVRRALVVIGLSVAALATLLVIGQHPFAASTFEFQEYHDYHGIIRTRPYPSLMVNGQTTPWLLVAPGKHGAGGVTSGLNGFEANLRGARIFRGRDQMLEILPGSVQPAGKAGSESVEADLGDVQLSGEIVDSKCYLGVMNPGNGKVHRDCAARCISGGIPPAFLVRDGAGQSMTMLLAGSDNRALTREVLGYVAEPIVIRGRLARTNGQLILRAEPRSFRRGVAE